jgi:signal transduction histidine kinase
LLLSSLRARRDGALRRSGAPREPGPAARTRRTPGSVLAPRNWRVASRLVLLMAVPAILGLVLAGFQLSSAAGQARAAGQISRLAALGQQVTALAQALEAERNEAAQYVAGARPASGLIALHARYVSTDAWAGRVRRLVRLDRPDATVGMRSSEAAALGGIAELPGLRRDTADGQVTALQVTNGYSAAIDGLFPVLDGMADGSASPVLISSVRALGALSRLTDQAARQQAILGAALTAGRFEPGALMALTVARAQQASDLAAFRSSASAQESWALTRTLDGALPRQARAVEQQAIAAGDGPLNLGPQAASQWQAGMSYLTGWLRDAGRQLGGWSAAYTKAQHRSATRSAITGGALAVVGLLISLIVALLIIRSVVRPLRRLEAAALDAAQSRLPAEIEAVTAEGEFRPALAALPAGVSPADEIGQVGLAIDRLRQEAVRLAGEEAQLREHAGVVVAGFFRRCHYLNDRLLRLIDSMELSEGDPDRLARLFQVDSLATRMRRHSDTALALMGHETPGSWTEPVPLVDVLRAAASEIEHYDQVALDVQSGVLVSEDAAVDTVHLLAELLENASAFSPAGAQVIVSAYLDPGGGALIGIADSGPGLADDQLHWLNWQLANPLPAEVRATQQMGLFAVAHLAARHDIRVSLTRAPGGGTTAEVHLPGVLIVPGAGARPRSAELGADYGGGGGSAVLAADPLSLVHRIAAAPPATPDPEPGEQDGREPRPGEPDGPDGPDGPAAGLLDGPPAGALDGPAAGRADGGPVPGSAAGAASGPAEPAPPDRSFPGADPPPAGGASSEASPETGPDPADTAPWRDVAYGS